MATMSWPDINHLLPIDEAVDPTAPTVLAIAILGVLSVLTIFALLVLNSQAG